MRSCDRRSFMAPGNHGLYELPSVPPRDRVPLGQHRRMVMATTSQGNGSGSNKPNVVFIMGDDIGWFNIGAYHRGMMAGRTPNLDKLASEGMIFTDYYAEASCTAAVSYTHLRAHETPE